MTKEQILKKWLDKENEKNSNIEFRKDETIYGAMEEYVLSEGRTPIGMKWQRNKPEFKQDCVLITATWQGHPNSKYWSYSLFQIKKSEGYNDNDEPAWYWGIFCDDGEEWGDIEDLTAHLYLQFPILEDIGFDNEFEYMEKFVSQSPIPSHDDKGLREAQENKFRNFLQWLGEQKKFQWTGDTWDENSGHDDFEQILMVDMYDHWLENIAVLSANKTGDQDHRDTPNNIDY